MLLKPNIKLNKITDINLDILKKYNITSLILDVDNTLSTHHGEILTEGLPEWLNEMKNGCISLIILSNSKNKRVEPFANKINLPFISLGLKPLPFGFIKALNSLRTKKRNTAIVGDQIFTDVLGGNIVGLNTILLTPIKLENTLGFRFKRKIEKMIFRLYKIENTEV